MNKSLFSIAVAAALIGSAAPALAGGEDPGAWKLGVKGIYVIPDNSRDVDRGFGAAVYMGRVVNENWDWSVNGFMSSHDFENSSSSYNFNGLGVDADRVFNRDRQFSPLITVGTGWRFEDAGFRGDIFAKAGVGALIDLGNFGHDAIVQLRGDGSFVYGIADNMGDWVVGLGVQIAWGGKSPVVPVAALPPPPPPPPPAPPPPPPPAPPVDTDGDGVVDSADLCPNTTRGERVDARGCSCDVTVRLQFAFDSANLTDGDIAQLDELVVTLRNLQFIEGEAVGHTDSVGAADFNQGLSERRAQTVASYLESKGIAQGRIKVSGMGLTQPIADNATAEGRALNRRVELKRTNCTR